MQSRYGKETEISEQQLTGLFKRAEQVHLVLVEVFETLLSCR